MFTLTLAGSSHGPASLAPEHAKRVFVFMWLKEEFQWGLVVQTLNINGRIYGIDLNREEKNPVNTNV